MNFRYDFAVPRPVITFPSEFPSDRAVAAFGLGATALFTPTDSKELLLGQESKFMNQKRTSATAMTY